MSNFWTLLRSKRRFFIFPFRFTNLENCAITDEEKISLGEWTRNYGSAATERKVYAGKGIRYFSNIGVAEFLIEATELHVGDKLLITGHTTGAMYLTLDEARVNLKPVDTVRKGMHVSFKVPDRIRPNDKLYLIRSTGASDKDNL